MRRKITTTRKKRAVSGIRGKKRKTTGTRRRRKVNGTDDIMGMLMKYLALGVGALTGRELNAIVQAAYPTLDPTISGIGQAAIGFLLGKLFPKESFLVDMGDGMAAQGIMVAAVSQVSVLQGMPVNKRLGTYQYGKVGKLSAVAGRVRTLGKINKNALGGNFSAIAGNFSAIAGPRQTNPFHNLIN